MTWVSERSGSASSRIAFRVNQASATKAATVKRVRSGFLAQKVMILRIMGALRSSVLLRFHRPVQGGAKPGLGIEEEVGLHHHGLPLPDTREDQRFPLASKAGDHFARGESA